MKYPEQQFKKLVATLQTLSEHVENLKEVNPHALHFLCYQQYNSGQRHNSFVVLENNTITRQHAAEAFKQDYKYLFQEDNSFELYPNNTNDSNIETAVKKALKLLS